MCFSSGHRLHENSDNTVAVMCIVKTSRECPRNATMPSMRRHGWSGDIPADDEEAITRIVTASRKAIDERGTLSMSEIAQSLGITRATLYRYFPNQEALLRATAVSAVGRFLDHLA